MQRSNFIVSTLFLAMCAQSLVAQDTGRVPAGVVLSTTYEVGRRPLLAVRPLGGSTQTADVAQTIAQILERDFEFSDRFEMGAVPAELSSGAVNYRAWNSLNVVYLVTGELTPAGTGYRLQLELHDVPLTTLKGSKTYDLPSPANENFRMAVHAVSDDVVRTLTGQPGIAATRVAFVRRTGNGYELMLVDYDGENLERVVSVEGGLYSPAFSPDGSRLAYGLRAAHQRVELQERDLTTGRVRVISARPELSYAPAYSPDGRKLAFAVSIGGVTTEINDYDLAQNCCIRRLTRGPRTDLSPTYSPDGQRIAFVSDRTGYTHIYIMPAEGGEPTMVTPYNTERVSFVEPDWSPTGNMIAFTGESRGVFQIMLLEVNRPGVARQITTSGRNESPSWAPDGRHIVYVGVGSEGPGLYVMDVQTGRTRRVVAGSRMQMPEWSPTLLRSGAANTH